MKLQIIHEELTSTQQCPLCALLEESFRAQQQVLRTRVINASQVLIFLVDSASNKQSALDQINIILAALPK